MSARRARSRGTCDHLARGHHRGGDVGDVALESYRRLRAGKAGLVEDAVTGAGLDEAGGLGGAFTGDDRADTGLLGVERLLIAPRSFGRIRPDRPPCPR
jgi:hypothetical protein